MTLRKKLCGTAIAAAAVALAAPASADTTGWADPDDNRVILQEILDNVGYVEAKYNTGPIHVETEWLDSPRIFAYADAYGITINKHWSTGTVAQLEAAVNDDIAAGYHNSGCNAAATIGIHEAAHVIDARRGGEARVELGVAEYYTDPAVLHGSLAGYSFTPAGDLDIGEALAEAFQAVECGTADDVEWQIHQMLVG
jgi:hypothetical protein